MLDYNEEEGYLIHWHDYCIAESTRQHEPDDSPVAIAWASKSEQEKEACRNRYKQAQQKATTQIQQWEGVLSQYGYSIIPKLTTTSLKSLCNKNQYKNGKKLLNASKVESNELIGEEHLQNNLQAQVRSEQDENVLYQVNARWNLHSGRIIACTCTCPYYQKNKSDKVNKFCKHIVAVFLQRCQ